MTARDLVKLLAFKVLGSGLRSRVRVQNINKSRGRLILNLHRVREPDGSEYIPLKPRLFEELLQFISKNFRTGTFEDADHKKVILSFDDGYKDFINVAAPLLKKYGIRCNHNVIPECIETGLPPFNVIAQDFVGKAPAELVRRLDIPGFSHAGQHLSARLSMFIKTQPIAQQRKLGEYLLPQFFAWQNFEPTPMMNRTDVLQMSSEHEVGAHSYSHANMDVESEDYLRDDVLRCRQYFADLGLPMNIYAFPNGNCTSKQIKVVENMGIKHVLLVGNNFDTHPSRHSRFTFDALSRGEMHFKALGGLQRVPA